MFSRRQNKPSLGFLLKQVNALSDDQIEEGLSQQKRLKEILGERASRLGDLLIRLGFISADQLRQILDAQQGLSSSRSYDRALAAIKLAQMSQENVVKKAQSLRKEVQRRRDVMRVEQANAAHK